MGTSLCHIHIDNRKGLDVSAYFEAIQRFMREHPSQPLDCTDQVKQRNAMIKKVPQMAKLFGGPLPGMELILVHNPNSHWLSLYDQWLSKANTQTIAELAAALETMVFRTVLFDSDQLDVHIANGNHYGSIKNGKYDPNELAYDYANMTAEEILNTPTINAPYVDVRECEIPPELRTLMGLDESRYQDLLEILKSEERSIDRANMLTDICDLLGIDRLQSYHDYDYVDDLEAFINNHPGTCKLTVHRYELETYTRE